MIHNFTLRWQRFELHLGLRTAIMGIVNITPDSFSDGGRFFSLDTALAQAEALVQAGADILDIGGESTRPYAAEVSEKEEMRRVLPVIERLARRIPVPISIDTYKSTVAEAALNAGAAMINDISALHMDTRMAQVAARHDVPLILMHMKGTPRTMQVDPYYDDLLGEVSAYLKAAMNKAISAGVARHNLIIDPGIGFGKTLTHNLQLLQQLDQLAALGVPILVGASRKAFIRKLLSDAFQIEITADRPEVETGSQAAVAMAVLKGAHIVRVHDVANTKAMVTILDAIRR